MNERQARFAREYCVDENATQAAIRAGYSPHSAHDAGCRLLSDPEVADFIEEHRRNVAAVAEIDQAAILRRWWELANADPNELTQLRRVNCRHCWGVEFRYQWTAQEFERALRAAIKRNDGEVPDGLGGFGWNEHREPNPACPECGGEGTERPYFKDTRHLSPAARRLFAGVKTTRDGVQVLMHDQQAALVNLARWQGMLVDRKEVSGPGGGPIGVATLRPEDLTDEQLAAIIARETTNQPEDES